MAAPPEPKICVRRARPCCDFCSQSGRGPRGQGGVFLPGDGVTGCSLKWRTISTPCRVRTGSAPPAARPTPSRSSTVRGRSSTCSHTAPSPPGTPQAQRPAGRGGGSAARLLSKPHAPARAATVSALNRRPAGPAGAPRVTGHGRASAAQGCGDAALRPRSAQAPGPGVCDQRAACCPVYPLGKAKPQTPLGSASSAPPRSTLLQGLSKSNVQTPLAIAPGPGARPGVRGAGHLHAAPSTPCWLLPVSP